jgi:fatty acid desaturase
MRTSIDLTYSAHQPRDYSLTGPDTERAIAAGLAAIKWYHSDLSREKFKSLIQKKDAPALRDTAIWIALHFILAANGIYFWGSWVAWPFWIAYGVVYGSACDARWHECGHGTAFKTRWMNKVVYQIASFQIMRNPVLWKWSHVRHHTDTLIVGRDPEIAWMQPVGLVLKALAFTGLVDTFDSIRNLARNAIGRFSDDEWEYLPHSEAGIAIFLGAGTSRHLFCRFGGGLANVGGRHRLGCAGSFAFDWRATHLWLLALCDDGTVAARRAERGCRGPSPEFSHGLHEPDQPLDLLEHELPRRTSHVPDGSLSRASRPP